MEATQTKPGLKVRSVKHPEDRGEIVRVVFEGKGTMVRWNGEAEEHPALASLLMPAEAADTHTVSIQAAIETEDGVFEDQILGTFPGQGYAEQAAKAYAKENPGETAQIISALPTEPAFDSWDSLRALIYVDTDEGLGLVKEAF